MVNFTHYLPTKFVFGRGVENQVGEEVKKLGATKVLIHYGGGSAVRSDRPSGKFPGCGGNRACLARRSDAQSA